MTGTLVHTTAPSPRTMILRAWRPIGSAGSLRGFADLELPIGLVIFDCPIHVSHGRPWAALPGRPVIDKAGRHAEDPSGSGKRAWVPMAQWRDRDIAARWSDRVVELIRGADPGAFDDGGAP